jgi:hypothetical protein
VRRGAAILAALLGGCSLSPGAVPDAGRCAPSPEYFAEVVQVNYLDANQCARPDCHGFDDGHGYYRLRPFGTAPAPGTALADWPPAWRQNYYESIQLVRCDDALASRLLSVPEGRADPHPPGDSVDNHASAEGIFQQWVATP